MRSFKLIIINVIPLILIINCWKKQHHDVTAPEMPHYTVLGFARDVDSKIPLQNVTVAIDNEKTITDSLGFYRIEKVYVGMHTIEVIRDSYRAFAKDFFLSYADRQLDLKVPKPLLAEPIDIPMLSLIGGICPVDNSIAIMPFENSTKEKPWFSAEIYEMSGERTFTKVNSFKERFTADAYAMGLEHVWGSYWFCINDMAAPTTLYEITAKNKIRTKLSFPYFVKDLTFDGHDFWMTNGRQKIIKASGLGEHFEEHFAPGSSTSGISWDGKSIWSSDEKENLLFQYDENMSVIRTFKPFIDRKIDDKTFINYLSHLTFDSKGNLWGSGSTSSFSSRAHKIVKFKLPE